MTEEEEEEAIRARWDRLDLSPDVPDKNVPAFSVNDVGALLELIDKLYTINAGQASSVRTSESRAESAERRAEDAETMLRQRGLELPRRRRRRARPPEPSSG